MNRQHLPGTKDEPEPDVTALADAVADGVS